MPTPEINFYSDIKENGYDVINSNELASKNYITSVTLTGDVTGSGTGSFTTTLGI